MHVFLLVSGFFNKISSSSFQVCEYVIRGVGLYIRSAASLNACAAATGESVKGSGVEATCKTLPRTTAPIHSSVSRLVEMLLVEITLKHLRTAQIVK